MEIRAHKGWIVHNAFDWINPTHRASSNSNTKAGIVFFFHYSPGHSFTLLMRSNSNFGSFPLTSMILIHLHVRQYVAASTNELDGLRDDQYYSPTCSTNPCLITNSLHSPFYCLLITEISWQRGSKLKTTGLLVLVIPQDSSLARRPLYQ